MKGPIYELQELRVGYRRVPVLRGLSLDIPEGCFTAVIGPNGGGKSTLLRTMSRMLKPTSGTIRLDGMDLWSLDPGAVARVVGFVPQVSAIDFDFTVEDIVLMGRYPHLTGFQRPGAADVRVAEKSMAATGVLHLRDRSAACLSGGEYQRVLIARGLTQDPRVLLLDEPTAHLDLTYQAEILALLKELNTRGLSVIAVLHDLNLAAQFFDSFILIAGGQVVAAGDTGQVLAGEVLSRAYSGEIRVERYNGRDLRILADRPGNPAEAAQPQGVLRASAAAAGGGEDQKGVRS